MGSLAISVDNISRVVGYIIKKGTIQASSPNLPQRIAIFAEANEANQATLDTDAKEVTSAKQAGDLYGYGSPIHMIMRILRPFSGDGVGSIPTVVYPQAKAVAASARVITVTPSGVATGNGTHYLLIAGRDNVDGELYAINVVQGDTVSDISDKIQDAVNNVLGSPMSATSDGYEATLTTKWNGLTAQSVQVSVDTGDNDLGISYAVTQTQAGAGTPSISGGLNQILNNWVTWVINAYGTEATSTSALEAFNGIADSVNPTGRYQGRIMKPFVAVCGSVADDPSSFTDAKKDQMTLAIAPAPASPGCPWEAAANMTYLAALTAQNNPNLDVAGQSYPDQPIPRVGSIGSMATYTNRDAFVKKGCSTVDLVAERYKVQDFVTTYHPDGELPPQFRYCRNLVNIDFNIRYGYYLLEQLYVVDHQIAKDADIVDAERVIKPKQWVQRLNQFAEDLVKRGLCVDATFMQESITVDISDVNPDRLETFFRYKRSGFVRVAATTGEANFNFGNA